VTTRSILAVAVFESLITNSTNSICHELVGQQVVQQAVQHSDLSSCCEYFRLCGIFVPHVSTTCCGFVAQLVEQHVHNKSQRSKYNWSLGSPATSNKRTTRDVLATLCEGIKSYSTRVVLELITKWENRKLKNKRHCYHHNCLLCRR